MIETGIIYIPHLLKTRQMNGKKEETIVLQMHHYPMLIALRFVHVMYGAREISVVPPCLTRVLRRASGSFAMLFKSCVTFKQDPPARHKTFKLTARRFRIPGTMCGHHFVSVFRNASSLLPLGLSHAVNSSTCE